MDSHFPDDLESDTLFSPDLPDKVFVRGKVERRSGIYLRTVRAT